MTLSLTLLFKSILLKGDVKLTQSNAILRHIARKNGMVGKTDAEKDRINMMEHEVMDFRLALVKIAYDPNFVSFSLRTYFSQISESFFAFQTSAVKLELMTTSE
jgi:hypothetical protein